MHERDDPVDDIGTKALERLWDLVLGRVDEGRIRRYRHELKKYSGAVIDRAVSHLLKDQGLSRIPPVSRMLAVCRDVEDGPAREVPRPPTPVIQIDQHQWYPLIQQGKRNFSAHETSVFEREAAALIREGYDPQTAEAIAYGMAVLTRKGGGEQLGREVQNFAKGGQDDW